MNADEILMRLKMFSPDMSVRVAVPVSGGNNKVLSILAVHHHGLDKDVVDHDRGGVEIFTSAWETVSDSSETVTVKDIVARLEKHHDDAHVRVGVPWDPDPTIRDRDHHGILMIETVGFAKAALVGDRVPIELITEPWDSLSMIVRTLFRE